MAVALEHLETQILSLQPVERLKLVRKILESCGPQGAIQLDRIEACEAIDQSLEEFDRGEGIPAEDVHRELFGRTQ